MDLKYPLWQEPLAAALLELNPKELLAKVQQAQKAIAARFQELPYEEKNEEEFRLLCDALALIRQLKENPPPCLGQKDRLKMKGGNDL